MKTRIIILGLLMSITLGVSARTYVKGEYVFLDTQMSDEIGDWTKDGAKIFLYFFQSNNQNNSEWVTMSPIMDGNKIYYGTMQSYHSWYDRVIVIRKSSKGKGGNWDNIWNQTTCDITIPDANDTERSYNFLHVNNCGWNDNKWYWKIYSPEAAAIQEFAANEPIDNIITCPDAVGDPIVLRPKLNSAGNDYEYTETRAYAWYKYVEGEIEDGKQHWISLDQKAGSERESEDAEGKDYFGTLSDDIDVGVHYFLYSSRPNGRHHFFIKSDATNCQLDCSITAFETANSAVNADDNTFTLDGMVAFGSAPDYDLVIECEGRKTSIHSPKSPQTFSLTGVPAATEDGKTTTATAYFTLPDNPTIRHCEKTITIDVPNVKDDVKETTIHAYTKEQIVLKPEDASSPYDFVWIINGKEYKKEDLSGVVNYTIPNTITKDSVITCIYKEYFPPAGSMDDLMENGNYEKTSGYGIKGNVSTMSDYVFWGRYPQTGNTQIDFYTNTTINPDGWKNNGFAVVRNAYNFHSAFAKVVPLEGDYFALFDAESGESGGNKKAWYIQTKATSSTSPGHPQLQLKAGTTYLLSFWAANINNYGEMDNPARFKFRIEYNGKKWESKELNLGDPEFRNNIWHQHSEIFRAPEDCDDVVISVVNLNTNSLIIGNDFALDDIQFRPISSVSKVVKSQQKYNVYIHDPKITSFKATTIPLKCDEGPEYKVAFEVKYRNPKGQLIIEPFIPANEESYTHTLPPISYDTEGTFKDTVVINKTHSKYTWDAYFEGRPDTKAAPKPFTERAGMPSVDTFHIFYTEPLCDELYTTLVFKLKYRYQPGKLQYWVDDMTPKEDTYIETLNPEWVEIENLQFGNIPADGKDTHKLHIKFYGPDSCEKTYDLPRVPLARKINEVKMISDTVKMVTCSTTSYDITVQVTLPYDATGEHIYLFYDDNGKKDQKSGPFEVSGKTATGTITVHNINNGTHNIEAAYDTDSKAFIMCPNCTVPQLCKEAIERQYASPVVAQIHDFDVTPSQIACDDEDTYSVSGTINFDMKDGDLVVQYDDKHKATVTYTSATTADFVITGMDAKGEQLYVKAWFTGSPDEDCKKVSNTFTAPEKPQVVAKDISFPEPGCDDLTTFVFFDLEYINQQGKLQYWVDDMTPKENIYIEPQSTEWEKIYHLDFDGIPADGKTHKLHVKFTGPNSCEETYDIKAPLTRKINEVKITSDTVKMVTCSATSYNIDVQVTLPYDATGENIHLYYDDNEKELTSDPLVVSGKTATGTITVHNINNGMHNIEAAYDTCPNCTIQLCKKAIERYYASPVVAQIHDFYVTPSQRTCDGEDTYSVSGTIKFDMKDGDLIVQYDEKHKATVTYTSATTADFVITGMDAEGEQLYVQAWFTGSPDGNCKKESYTFIAPDKPQLTAKNFYFPEPGCDDLTTSVLFDLEYINQQGVLQYWVDDMTPKEGGADLPYSTIDQPLSLNFGGIPADGKPHKLHVKFTGPNSCEKTYDIKAPLTRKIDEVKMISDTVKMVTCSATSYNIDVQVTLPYDATGENIHLYYDDNEKELTSDPLVVSGKTATGTITVHNINNGMHNIEAAYDTCPNCTIQLCKKAIERYYASPVVAQIHDFYVTPSQRTCDGEDTYSVSGTIKFDMKDGDLIVQYDEKHKAVIPNATSPAAFTIENMTAEGDNLTLMAWFSGSPADECKQTSNVFESPVKPHIKAKNFRFSEPDCGSLYTTLTFDLDYRYQQGDLLINGVKADNVYYAEADKDLLTLTGLTAEYPADGKNDHHLVVTFDGKNSCSLDTLLPAAPLSPVINSVTVTPEKKSVLCHENSYTATVTIVTPYDATGLDILLNCEGKESKVRATGTSTSVQLQLTSIGGTIEKITAAFADRKECEESGTFETPTRALCFHDADTICEGENYVWERHNQTYTKPAVGVDTFIVGTDSLFLTVIALPQIKVSQTAMTCDNENELRIPFTAAGGNPTMFIISKDGKDYTGSIDGREIVFSALDLEAGDYTMSVTVGDTASACTTTASVSFTIAVSGQMYSKWNDVLFVSNKDERYVTYQWYENGKPLTGETQQRLYNPNGLPGLYFCEMTTTDNKTIYTCPQRFDEVTPSRSENTSQKVQSTTVYDAMGRIIGSHPGKGIYIVFEQLENGETRARKIAIYE